MAYEYVVSTGIVAVDTSQVRANVVTLFESVFGTSIDTDSSTSLGVLIDMFVAERVGVLENDALLANQINPSFSGGIFLEAVAALLGVTRIGDSASTFTTNPDLTGTPNLNIPAGTQAQTTGGDLFELITATVLDATGNGTGEFQSVEDGAIPALAGTLTLIVTDVVGWETITNSVDATLGTTQESDVALRNRRRRTLAVQGVSMIESISSAVQALDNVNSLVIRENVSNVPAVIDGVTLGSHSIYVAVSGGTDEDIGAALLANKSLGAGWNSQFSPVNINVTDPTTGQVYPVEFDRQTDVPILCQVTVIANTETDAFDKVRESILDYIAGELLNEDGWVVGADVSPFELAGAVNTQYPLLTVTVVNVTKAASVDYQPTTIAIDIWEQATMEADDITVTVL